MTGEPQYRRYGDVRDPALVGISIEMERERKHMTTDPFADTKYADAGVPDDEVFEIDLSDVPDDYRVEPGKYPAQLVDVDKKTSQAGNPMWVFQFKLIGSKNRGFELRDHAVIKPDALWKVKQNLKALHLLGEDGKPNFTKESAIGRRVVLDIVDQEYQGENRSSIQRVMEHPDGPVGEEPGEPGEPPFGP